MLSTTYRSPLLQFGGLEALITAFCDQFPSAVGRHRELFVLALCAYCFIGGLTCVTYVSATYECETKDEISQGGPFVIEFLDYYGVTFSLLFIVLIETLAVCWCYGASRTQKHTVKRPQRAGVDRLCTDAEAMLGYKPSLWWRFSWRVLSPTFICVRTYRCDQGSNDSTQVIFAFAVYDLGGGPPMDDYEYPEWSRWLGWALRLSSICCIPAYCLYCLCCVMSGSVKEVCFH